MDVKGEVLELKDTINTMVDQLSAFAAEVTRVAREVGTEGTPRRPGRGRRRLRHLEGPDRERQPARRQPHHQVRNIAAVTTAVAKGDLSQKITVEAKGEVGQLAGTINTMVDQLSTFAAEVTRVAQEVGTEGKLGVQAQVEGVSGVVEGPDRQRQPARRDADDAAARDRGRVDRRDPGRPDALDHGRGGRRGLGPQGQHQPDDRQPPRDDRAERRAGLAQLEPRPLLRDAAGPARPEDGRAPADERGDAARRRPPRRLLRRRGLGRGRGDGAAPDRHVRLQGAQDDREPLQGRRGARRPGRARAEGDRDHAGARGLHQDRLGARRGGADEHHRPPRPLRGER